MSGFGARLSARVPAWGSMLPMIVYVPAGPNPERRVRNCATAIALMYDRAARAKMPEADPERKCLWCENEPEPGRGMMYWSPSDDEPISHAPRGAYCSTQCWLAAS